MYDSLTIWYSFKNEDEYLQTLSIMEKQKPFTDIRTGEIAYKAYWKNFKCLVKVTGLFMSGSLTKYFHGDNIQSLTKQDTQRAVNRLSTDLNLNMSNADVFRIDISINLVMKYPCSSYYSYIGNSRYYEKSTIGNKSTIQFDNKLRTKLFYDKIKEHTNKKIPIPDIFKNKNILRFELRYMRRLKKQFNQQERIKLHQLYDESFYIECCNRLQSEYKNIEKLKGYAMTNNKPNKPSEFKEYLATIGINSIGYESALELLEQYKSELSKSNYNRIKQEIKNLAKNNNYFQDSELIKELDEKVKTRLKYYR